MTQPTLTQLNLLSNLFRCASEQKGTRIDKLCKMYTAPTPLGYKNIQCRKCNKMYIETTPEVEVCLANGCEGLLYQIKVHNTDAGTYFRFVHSLID